MTQISCTGLVRIKFLEEDRGLPWSLLAGDSRSLSIEKVSIEKSEQGDFLDIWAFLQTSCDPLSQ